MEPARIYHVVCQADFGRALAGSAYRPPSLAREGFVHCATRASVLAVANDFFQQSGGPVLLLEIDPGRLECEVRYEAPAPLPGGGDSHLQTARVFPHVYGSVPVDAVVGIGELPRSPQGFGWPPELRPPHAFLAAALDRPTPGSSEESMSWARGAYRLEEGSERVDIAAVHALLRGSYWASGRTREQLEQAVRSSTCFSLLHGSRQVGFFRALSDRGAYTYLMDFIIEAEHRRGGVGSWALDAILRYPPFAGTRFILVTKDAQDFYAKAGFVPHPYDCMIRL